MLRLGTVLLPAPHLARLGGCIVPGWSNIRAQWTPNHMPLSCTIMSCFRKLNKIKIVCSHISSDVKTVIGNLGEDNESMFQQRTWLSSDLQSFGVASSVKHLYLTNRLLKWGRLKISVPPASSEKKNNMSLGGHAHITFQRHVAATFHSSFPSFSTCIKYRNHQPTLMPARTTWPSHALSLIAYQQCISAQLLLGRHLITQKFDPSICCHACQPRFQHHGRRVSPEFGRKTWLGDIPLVHIQLDTPRV